MRSRRPDARSRHALAALLVAGLVGLPASAQQVFDEGADFGSRITFRAGHPAEGQSLDDAFEDRETSSRAIVASADVLGRHADMTVDVTGFADADECGVVDRVAVAWRRATLVRDRRVELGVDPSRPAVSSHGAARPVFDGPRAHPRNRRVEIGVVRAGRSEERAR